MDADLEKVQTAPDARHIVLEAKEMQSAPGQGLGESGPAGLDALAGSSSDLEGHVVGYRHAYCSLSATVTVRCGLPRFPLGPRDRTLWGQSCSLPGHDLGPLSQFTTTIHQMSSARTTSGRAIVSKPVTDGEGASAEVKQSHSSTGGDRVADARDDFYRWGSRR